MKPEAQKILTMIETVSSETSVTVLDEIDARVWCLWKDVQYINFHAKEKPITILFIRNARSNEVTIFNLFTRSIDAQEALRREGWLIQSHQLNGGHWQVDLVGKGEMFEGPFFPTEPLARLHAWVQVMGMEG